MKKILASLLVIGVVGSLLTGATFAVFTDQEVLAGNTVATSDFELTLNHSAGKPFAITGAYPGFWSDWEYIDVFNSGDTPFEAMLSFPQTGGDTPLYNALTLNLKTSGFDSDCTNGDAGEGTIYNGLLSAYPASTVVSSLTYWHLANEDDASGSPADNIRAGWTERICQRVGVDAAADSTIQGMSTTFDEVVDAAQDND